MIAFLCLCGALVDARTDQLDDAKAAAAAGKTEAALALVGKLIAADGKDSAALRLRARLLETAERYTDALADLDRLIVLEPKQAELYQQRGVVQFKRGAIDASIRDFDRYIELRPQAKVSHWQRGISYYYARRYEDGCKQFEGYQDYDDSDVENAVWRFMCMARRDGIDKARQRLLKIGNDRRVPMRQVYDLFKGELKPMQVLAAAREGNPSAEQLNARLFYAHLYVGIWYDLVGERQPALEHLDRAVAQRIDHYMWDVARVHRDLLKADQAKSR